MEIKSKYIDNWRLINQLSIDWSYPQSEIYKALEQEEFAGNDRLYCNNPKNPILKNILNFVNAKAPDLLSELCDQDQFKKDLWHLENKEQITKNTVHICSFIYDKPGFTTSTHIDSRMTISSGMFFFNESDDENQSTYFYTTFDEKNPFRISSQCGNGWYAANTHYSWHIGSNNSLRNRYSLLCYSKLILK